MRTTVNVEDDVFFAAKAIAKAAHSSVGAVLSDWARIGQQQALSGPTATAGSSSGVKAKSVQTRNGIALLPKRGVMVTSEQVYRLLDEDAA
jgi:hypothetical protein